MKSRELNIMLITKIPDILPLYESEVSWQEGHDTGSYVVFADVLIPHILKKLDEADDCALRVAFDYIEQVFCLNDEYANGVLTNAIENLFYSCDDKKNAEQYMGKRCKEYFVSLLNE